MDIAVFINQILRTSESVRQLVNEYEEHKQSRLYESVMQIIVQSNKTRFQEVDSMCQALYDLFKDQLEQMVDQKAEERANQIAEERANQIVEERTVEMVAEAFSDGETATLLHQVKKKIQKGKSFALIVDELEETEEVILPLYERVNAQFAMQG